MSEAIPSVTVNDGNKSFALPITRDEGQPFGVTQFQGYLIGAADYYRNPPPNGISESITSSLVTAARNAAMGPLSMVYSAIENKNDNVLAHSTAIAIANQQKTPGFEAQMKTIGGKEVPIYVDASNPKAPPIILIPPELEQNTRNQSAAFREGLKEAKDAVAAIAVKERDQFIFQHDMDGYVNKLEEFANVGLFKGLKATYPQTAELDQQSGQPGYVSFAKAPEGIEIPEGFKVAFADKTAIYSGSTGMASDAASNGFEIPQNVLAMQTANTAGGDKPLMPDIAPHATIASFTA